MAGPVIDDKTGKDKLPGNHGQFGESNATETFKTLEDQPAPADTVDKGPKQTNAGERS